MESSYLDWNRSMEVLERAYKAGLFVLVIGPKGTGKTTLVRRFAESIGVNLESINFSLRTRESHLVGTKTLDNEPSDSRRVCWCGSMRNGGMLYLDELNAAEADVLIRLDESLDDRRQIVLKESAGETVRAQNGWFVVGTITPSPTRAPRNFPPNCSAGSL